MRDHIVYIVSMNTYKIYKMIEDLARMVQKRKDKGLPIDREHLANCSMMKNITLAAKRAEEGNITKEERKAGGYQIADYILEGLTK